jgi:hypothetical protein
LDLSHERTILPKLQAGIQSILLARPQDIRCREFLIDTICRIGLTASPNAIYGAYAEFCNPAGNTGLTQAPEEIADAIVYLTGQPIETYVEIGCNSGWTAAVITACLSKFSLKSAIGVDIQPYFQETAVIRSLLPQLTFTLGSRDTLPAQHFDFAFIDADHSYDAVRRDYEVIGRRARMVMFHDVNDRYIERYYPCGGTVKFWREARDSVRSKEIFYDADPEGGLRTLGLGFLHHDA